MSHDDYSDRKSAINNNWVRSGCVLAAFVMAVTLFVEGDASGGGILVLAVKSAKILPFF
jgi:hypothetical protein